MQGRVIHPFDDERELLADVVETQTGVETAFGSSVGFFNPSVDARVVDDE